MLPAIPIILKAIPLLKKYWEIILIVFLVICFGIFIAKLKRDIQVHKESIVGLQEQVEVLEISNQTLIKNYAFYKERIRLLEAYSNSGRLIKSISNFTLPNDLRNVLITIEDEYVGVFPKLRLTNVLEIENVVEEINELRAEEEMRMKVENYTNIESVETVPELLPQAEGTNETNI